jgi:dipeptidyl aminopeptidase/acylaminoacyl peptidase
LKLGTKNCLLVSKQFLKIKAQIEAPMKIFITLIFLLLGFYIFGSAQANSGLLMPEQTLYTKNISDIHFSPDGARVVFVVSERLPNNQRNSDIWMYDLKTKNLRQLTNSPKTDNNPHWSPDGSALAFLSTRDGDAQIYTLAPESGKTLRLTSNETAISSFDWSPDGKQIAFLADEPQTAEERETFERTGEANVVDSDKPARLWLFDAAAKKSRQLTGGRWKISEFTWLPASSKILLIATDKPESNLLTNRIYSLETKADGKLNEISAPPGFFYNLSASPDGKSISYVASRGDGPAPHDLFVQSLAGGAKAVRDLTETSIDRPVYDYQWNKDGMPLVDVADGFKSAFYTVSLDGKAQRWANLNEIKMSGFDVNSAGTILYAGLSATAAPELFIAEANRGVPQKISNFNETFNRLPLIKPEMLRYRSFDNQEIEASLILPRGYVAGKRIPLVVLVHGGPTGSWDDSFDAWGQLLAARGYGVMYPNIRGSDSYGWKFLIANRGDWGGGDYKDVMAGVDELIRRGIADPNRLGIGGWSYGGYMAGWTITQTTRFKAAVDGAGISDLAFEFGTEDDPSYDEWFYGTPYEKLDGFIKSSPITYIKNARTPTLILQGENDPIDPIGQSQQLYRGLKRYGVEAQLVIYPREGHGFREEKHRLDMLNRIIGWFDKYIKP